MKHAEYIERDALPQKKERGFFLDYDFNSGWNACLNAIDLIPAADVRPVVTCGECKYWELSKIEPPFHVCTYVCGATFVRKAEDFCSRAAKREES